MPRLTDIGLESDLDWNSAARFRLQTRHIAALVERYLTPIQHERIWKVLVKCCSIPVHDHPKVIGGVLDVLIHLDARNFYTLTPIEKKAFALKAISDGITAAAVGGEIDPAPFEQALVKATEAGLINRWRSPKKPKSAPDRKHIAVLECVHEAESFVATLVVTDRRGIEVLRCQAIETRPLERTFVPKLKSLAWTDNATVSLDGKMFSIGGAGKGQRKGSGDDGLLPK